LQKGESLTFWFRVAIAAGNIVLSRNAIQLLEKVFAAK